MTYQFNIEEENGIYLVSVRGHMRATQDAAQLMRDVTEEVRRNESRKVLLDLCNLDSQALDYFERYGLINDLSAQPDKHCIRWAMVAPIARAKPLNDFETMARNRGYEFKGFHTIEEAANWLKG